MSSTGSCGEPNRELTATRQIKTSAINPSAITEPWSPGALVRSLTLAFVDIRTVDIGTSSVAVGQFRNDRRLIAREGIVGMSLAVDFVSLVSRRPD